MKKIISLLIFGLFPFSFLSSNPIVLPQAFISEIKFEDDNYWFLEIDFKFSQPFFKEQYDSICIKTLNGFSKINLDNIKDSTDLFVITNDSLTNPILLDNEGDVIKLYSFISNFYEPLIDSLVFGIYPGSSIDSIHKGYSITRLSYNLFSKDKTPTIGLPNDTTGTCGTLKGNIYDKNNNLVTKGNFILDNPISFQKDGTYSTKVFSRKVSFNYIENYVNLGFEFVRMDTIKLNINPDSLYFSDILIKNDFTVGIKEEKNELYSDIKVINYPNPFNASTNFALKVPQKLQNKLMYINIYNVIGKKIFSINIRNSSLVTWQGRDFNGSIVSSGIYYYQLGIANRVYKNGSMILLK